MLMTKCPQDKGPLKQNYSPLPRINTLVTSNLMFLYIKSIRKIYNIGNDHTKKLYVCFITQKKKKKKAPNVNVHCSTFLFVQTCNLCHSHPNLVLRCMSQTGMPRKYQINVYMWSSWNEILFIFLSVYVYALWNQILWIIKSI